MILPEDFSRYTKDLMGDKLYADVIEGLDKEPSVSIRLNPQKSHFSVQDIDDEDGEVAWCASGVYLKRRPNFTFDPLFHAGLYYVQEASSMFLDLIMRQYVQNPVMMLDLCAAPGGKSTLALGALHEGSVLFSNEPIRNRAQILNENIIKSGYPDVIVTNNFPADYRRSRLQFDVILCDVPCSGEGMFRKDEGAISDWSLQKVINCQKLQREIVADAWSCLKPDGLLIYSTCTFNTRENEENIRWISQELGAEVLPVNVDKAWNIHNSLLSDYQLPVYRFLPGLTRGEGLFMAVMRKNDDDSAEEVRPNKQKKQKQNKQKPTIDIKRGWLKNEDDFAITQQGDSIVAIPKRWNDIYAEAAASLKILHAGIELGTLKGKDIIPHQSLALSSALKADAFSKVGVNYEQAIAFLRKEAVMLPEDTNRGMVLLTYKGVPIGFEKNLGNRANNLYPQEWKIKSSHIPEGKNNIFK
jgi:16S rRNA C967 or C1407 C5-methylase (RsmB/RsmF family)/NOL1/NOP2/fmu family ribosome biogenesis protein